MQMWGNSLLLVSHLYSFLPIWVALVIFLLCLFHLLLFWFDHLPGCLWCTMNSEQCTLYGKYRKWDLCSCDLNLCTLYIVNCTLYIASNHNGLQSYFLFSVSAQDSQIFAKIKLTCTFERPCSCPSQPCPSPLTSSADPHTTSDQQKIS